MEEFVEWFVHMMRSKFGVEVHPEKIGVYGKLKMALTFFW